MRLSILMMLLFALGAFGGADTPASDENRGNLLPIETEEQRYKIHFDNHVVLARRTTDQKESDSRFRVPSEEESVTFDKMAILAYYGDRGADFAGIPHILLLAKSSNGDKYFMTEFNSSSKIWRNYGSNWKEFTSLKYHKIGNENYSFLTFRAEPNQREPQWARMREPRTIAELIKQAEDTFAAHFKWDRLRNNCAHFVQELFCKNIDCNKKDWSHVKLLFAHNKWTTPIAQLVAGKLERIAHEENPRRIAVKHSQENRPVPYVKDVLKMTYEEAISLRNKLRDGITQEICVRMFYAHQGRNKIFKGPSFKDISASYNTSWRFFDVFRTHDLEYTKVYLKGTYSFPGNEGRFWEIQTWNDFNFTANPDGLTKIFSNGTGTMKFEKSSLESPGLQTKHVWEITDLDIYGSGSDYEVRVTFQSALGREYKLYANEEALYVNNEATNFKLVACPDDYFHHGLFQDKSEMVEGPTLITKEPLDDRHDQI